MLYNLFCCSMEIHTMLQDMGHPLLFLKSYFVMAHGADGADVSIADGCSVLVKCSEW